MFDLSKAAVTTAVPKRKSIRRDTKYDGLFNALEEHTYNQVGEDGKPAWLKFEGATRRDQNNVRTSLKTRADEAGLQAVTRFIVESTDDEGLEHGQLFVRLADPSDDEGEETDADAEA